MYRWGFFIFLRTFAPEGIEVDIYDSTFGSKQELFSILPRRAAAGDWHLWKFVDAAKRARNCSMRANGRMESDPKADRGRRIIPSNTWGRVRT